MVYQATRLVPQRKPFLLVDELTSADSTSCTTSYVVDADCALVAGGSLLEVGLIEHMAQSAAALAGYHAMLRGAACPPMGVVGEVKGFHVEATPHVGQRIHTRIVLCLTVGGIRSVTAQTWLGEDTIARAQFKIYIADNETDSTSTYDTDGRLLPS